MIRKLAVMSVSVIKYLTHIIDIIHISAAGAEYLTQPNINKYKY